MLSELIVCCQSSLRVVIAHGTEPHVLDVVLDSKVITVEEVIRFNTK